MLFSYDLTLSAYFQKIQPFFPIAILQYRNKTGSLTQKKHDLQEIRHYYDGVLIVNDTIDLIDYADGLHLGQEDLHTFDPDPLRAVAKIRSRIGRKRLGLSTHSKEEILEANRLDLDYIGLGAYRPTQTKSEANVGGKALLKAATYSKHPVALIGGVRPDESFELPIAYKVIGSGLLGTG